MTKTSKTPKILKVELSRRCLLTSAAYAAGAAPILGAAVTIMPTPAAAQVKVPKSAVAYQEQPKGKLECSNCGLFQSPNACKNVAGDISPTAWCNIWVKK
jgi:hypothetical protein